MKRRKFATLHTESNGMFRHEVKTLVLSDTLPLPEKMKEAFEALIEIHQGRDEWRRQYRGLALRIFEENGRSQAMKDWHKSLPPNCNMTLCWARELLFRLDELERAITGSDARTAADAAREATEYYMRIVTSGFAPHVQKQVKCKTAASKGGKARKNVFTQAHFDRMKAYLLERPDTKLDAIAAELKEHDDMFKSLKQSSISVRLGQIRLGKLS